MNHEDRRLISMCLGGHSAAFGELVLRYQDRLFNAVVRVLDNPDDALDVVQDSFVSAYHSLASFKGDAEFYTWLYRIAFNAAVSVRRRRRPFVSLNAGRHGDPGLELADGSEMVRPGAALERAEDEAALQHGLNRLSPEHRAVLVLKDMEGMKYEQIADALGVPIGTIRSRIHRARLELRELLEAGDRPTPHPHDPATAAGAARAGQGRGETP